MNEQVDDFLLVRIAQSAELWRNRICLEPKRFKLGQVHVAGERNQSVAAVVRPPEFHDALLVLRPISRPSSTYML